LAGERIRHVPGILAINEDDFRCWLRPLLEGCKELRGPQKKIALVNPVPRAYARGFAPWSIIHDRHGRSQSRGYSTGLQGIRNIHPVPTVLDRQCMFYPWRIWNGVHLSAYPDP